MGFTASFYSAPFQAGENVVVCRRRGFQPSWNAPIVLSPHGHGGDATGVLVGGYGAHITEALCNAGYLVLGMDAGGPTAWGSDAGVDAMEAGRQWLVSTWGASSGKVHLYAFSMGGLEACNYAVRYPTKVASMALGSPGVDLGYHHATYGAEIDAAYGGAAGYTAARPTHDPLLLAQTTPSTFQKFPIKVWYNVGDPTVPESTALAFASAVGGPNISTVQAASNVGHTPASFDSAQIVNFLLS